MTTKLIDSPPIFLHFAFDVCLLMHDLKAITFETHVCLLMMFQLSILIIFPSMFSLDPLIMNSNYLTPLDTHDAPTSFPSSITEGHLNIFLLI